MHFSELTAPEQRVLGCLIEKRWTTPDQYPLSLNALRLACNQATNRDPVTRYDESTVRDAAQRLSRYGLARLASGHSSRAIKYRHLAEESLGLGREELAVLAVLLLRGPQTPGEIKLRSERMAPIASLERVDEVLEALGQRGFARRLPRRPGQKEDRFEHLLGGPGQTGVDEAGASDFTAVASAAATPQDPGMAPARAVVTPETPGMRPAGALSAPETADTLAVGGASTLHSPRPASAPAIAAPASASAGDLRDRPRLARRGPRHRLADQTWVANVAAPRARLDVLVNNAGIGTTRRATARARRPGERATATSCASRSTTWRATCSPRCCPAARARRRRGSSTSPPPARRRSTSTTSCSSAATTACAPTARASSRRSCSPSTSPRSSCGARRDRHVPAPGDLHADQDGATAHPTGVTTRHHAAAAHRLFRRTVPALVVPTGAGVRSAQVPVLTYHRVHTLPAVGQADLIVDPSSFAAELTALRSNGYHTISQAQLFDALYRGRPLPAKPVIISVDDGYVDDVRTILPDLLHAHMVATFFVITGRTSEPGFLDNAQIRALDRAGMDVGDHTAHHVDLTQLTPSQLKTETAGSRRALEAILGHPVYFFAYPFGAEDETVVRAVSAAGFSLAYTTAAGITESTTAPLTIPRIHVGRSETARGLVSLLAGA
jgi:uncharacterized protein YceH (UPF0502 family)/peptidoglycan/xylan/chitin deacetylase (PgdA/CDA1 family)